MNARLESCLLLAMLAVACGGDDHVRRDPTVSDRVDASVPPGPYQWDAGRYPHHPDPSLVSAGPSLVDASFSSCSDTSCGLDHYVSGFAYYDPAASPWSIREFGVSQGEGPALKVVLTTWPVDDCDPQAILDMDAQQSMGKMFALCAAYENEQGLQHTLETESGGDDSGGASSFYQVNGFYQCTLDVTIGNRMGGQPLTGTLKVFRETIPQTPAVATIVFQLKHCGVIDTEGQI